MIKKWPALLKRPVTQEMVDAVEKAARSPSEMAVKVPEGMTVMEFSNAVLMARATLPPRRGKTIYLSGPMKGYPQSNYPLFAFVAAQLRAAGHTVYNPSEFGHDGPPETFPLRKAFAEYAKFICEEADTIVLLPGWEASLGVSAELALAKNCRLEVVEFKDLKISFD